MGFADAYLLETGRSLLVVVDPQTAFMNVIFEPERLRSNIIKLLAAAKTLQIPVLATTQNAEKLGPLDPAIAEHLPEGTPVIDKMTFSCMGSTAFRNELEKLSDRTQAVLCGLETHVCITQTAHDLLDDGLVVHLAADAISSRTEWNYRYGLERLRHVGATVSCTESVIFEWLRRAGTPEFREVAKWLK
ncbi:MAG: hydrolase [Armatimonadota bacterium]|nr:MAG: hydrolase [Armatimonadota bacterium]